MPMTNPYRSHRFPAEIISYCVWLYYTFPLSFHDIEKMMRYRGITLTYEAIRGWCLKFVGVVQKWVTRCDETFSLARHPAGLPGVT